MGRELRTLRRGELIEIIYQLKKSEQELQNENDALKKQLESKRITLENAGSVADAALALTDIFAAAQASADIYLAELKSRKEEIERERDDIIAEARKKADEIIKNAAMQPDETIRE